MSLILASSMTFNSSMLTPKSEETVLKENIAYYERQINSLNNDLRLMEADLAEYLSEYNEHMNIKVTITDLELSEEAGEYIGYCERELLEMSYNISVKKEVIEGEEYILNSCKNELLSLKPIMG